MGIDERSVEPGSEIDLALQRALDAANLRAGDSVSASTATAVDDWEQSAAETGDAVAGFDGD
jgi:hypothetical protein